MPSGSRVCSSRYLGASRFASGLTAAVRSSRVTGPAGGALVDSAAMRVLPPTGLSLLLFGLRRGGRVLGAVRGQAAKSVLLLLQDAVGVLIGVDHLRGDEDGQLGAAGHIARALEGVSQEGDVLENRHSAFLLVLGIRDEAPDHDR